MGGDNKPNFMVDFLMGGTAGAVSKTITAPIERVKLIIQTQDANPRIQSGEVPRYTGIGNCFSRVRSEQGFKAFWAGNFTNCIRYFPTQAFNLAFKDTIKAVFPKYDPKKRILAILWCQLGFWWFGRCWFTLLRLSFGLCSYSFGL